MQQIAFCMQFLLGESPYRAQRLAKRWQHSMREISACWRRASLMSLNDALNESRDYQSEDLNRLAAFLRTTSTGIVLTGIHMGDYLQALFRILVDLPRRRVCIARRKPPSEQERQVFQKLTQCGFSIRVIRTGEPTAALRIYRNLRRGSVVVALYDLPCFFGETMPVQIFGKELHWVKGPVQMAARAGALIVPFVAFRENGPRCALHRVAAATGRENPVQESVQGLAALAETYICRFPEQWLHWHLVPEMLDTTLRRQ